MTQRPLISVVIPTYNVFDYLPEAIESVLAQGYEDVEVLLVDDGSPLVGAAEIAARYGGRVRYLRKPNGGVATARNFGIANSGGEFIALLDQDDRWLPGKLAKQVRAFDDPAVGLAYAGIRFFQNGGGALSETYFPGHPLGVHDIMAGRVLTVQTLLFRRRLAQSLGGFDESLSPVDDWDFCVRAANSSRVFGSPEVLAEARQHAQNTGSGIGMYEKEVMALAKFSRMHLDCRECKAACGASLERCRRAQYQRLCSRSAAAMRQQEYRSALSWRLASISFDPARAIRQIPAGIRRRLLPAGPRCGK